MKETDINEIRDVITSVLDYHFWYIEDYFPEDTIYWIVTNIYLCNDTSVEVSNRVNEVGTVIATEHRLSLILDEGIAPTSHTSTYIKTIEPICKYEQLLDDIYNIISTWSTCLVRIIN